MNNLPTSAPLITDDPAMLVRFALHAQPSPDYREAIEEHLDLMLEDDDLGWIATSDAIESPGYCDIWIALYLRKPKAIEQVTTFIQESFVLPKGSYIESDEGRIEIGDAEGIELAIDKHSLSATELEETDIDLIVERLAKALGNTGEYYSYHETEETYSLFFYGTSHREIERVLKQHLVHYPLCRNAQLRRVA